MKFKELRKGMAITFIDGDTMKIIDVDTRRHPGALDESCHVTILGADNNKHYIFVVYHCQYGFNIGMI